MDDRDRDIEFLREVLSHITGFQLSTDETQRWLDDARLWDLIDRDAFIDHYRDWDPKSDPRPFPQQKWKRGGGKNAPHKNPHHKAKMPETVEETEDEIKRIMSLPPFPGRKKKLKEWNDKKKHPRLKGEDTGEEHSVKGKGFVPPGLKEIEEESDD